MSIKYIKRNLLVGLFLCFATILCAFGFPRLVSVLKIMDIGHDGQAPIRSFQLTLNKSQREELFDQLRKFAEKHSFEYELTDFNTNGRNFQFWMSRNDLRIITSNVPPDPTVVFVDFYAKSPGAPVDETVVNDLMKDLKIFLSEIPNVIITE